MDMVLDTDGTVLAIFRAFVTVLFPAVDMHDMTAAADDALSFHNFLSAIMADAALNISFRLVDLIILFLEKL